MSPNKPSTSRVFDPFATSVTIAEQPTDDSANNPFTRVQKHVSNMEGIVSWVEELYEILSKHIHETKPPIIPWPREKSANTPHMNVTSSYIKDAVDEIYMNLRLAAEEFERVLDWSPMKFLGVGVERIPECINVTHKEELIEVIARMREVTDELTRVESLYTTSNCIVGTKRIYANTLFNEPIPQEFRINRESMSTSVLEGK